MEKINVKDRKVIFFAGLWLFSLVLIIFVQVMSNRNIQDDKTSQNLSRINSLLQDKYREDYSFPRSLDGLKSDNSYDNSYYDDIDTSKVTYTRVADNGYKICTTYKNERLSYKGEKGSQTMKLNEYGDVPEEHLKGNVCYTYTAEDDPYDYNNDYYNYEPQDLPKPTASSSATCVAAKSTAFKQTVTIKNIDDNLSQIRTDSETYTLCKNVLVSNAAGPLTQSSTLGLEITDVVTLSGTDKDHIDTVVVTSPQLTQ